MFPPLYFCICYVDTHVESHAIKINSVAICSRSKFNLTGLILHLAISQEHDYSPIIVWLNIMVLEAELNSDIKYFLE